MSGIPGRLEGRVALVTGSATGLGRWIVRSLAGQGADVAINYRKSEGEARSLAGEVARESGVHVGTYRADVSTPEGARSLVEEVLEDLGSLDILVNNAGDWLHGPIMETSEEDFDAVIRGNVHSTFYCTKYALPHLRRSGHGRIVNLGVVGAQNALGVASISAYYAAKSAVVSFTRSVALEEARYGITANVVCPGDIRDKKISIAEAERVGDPKVPAGRPATGEDIARAVLLLVGEDAAFITGNVLLVTGGWRI